MDPTFLIGGLAVFTIGAAVVALVLHYGNFLRDPANMDVTKNVLQDGTCASTSAGESLPGDTTLKQRLDGSVASQHPDDPALKPVAAH